jgi:hypothetical protein
VIGRALRRQSYDLNENGLFNVEYADVLGIPFDFTAKPVIAPPQPPRETRKYRPDFIVQVDDGKGAEDPLNLVVEIKGYRGEDAKEKKSTMDAYWVPGVNNLKQFGRWAFAEFTDVFQIDSDFKEKVEAQFNKMIETMSADQGKRGEMEA